MTRSWKERLGNIPQELKQLDRWVAWRSSSEEGKFKKIPVNSKTGGNAKVNDPDSWDTFDAAIKCAEDGGLDGIGFAGHQLIGYSDPDPGNPDQVRQSIFLFGGVYIGIALPLTA